MYIYLSLKKVQEYVLIYKASFLLALSERVEVDGKTLKKTSVKIDDIKLDMH